MFHDHELSSTPDAWPRSGHVQVFKDALPEYDPELGEPHDSAHEHYQQQHQQHPYHPNIIIERNSSNESAGTGAFKYVLILLAGLMVVVFFSYNQEAKDELSRSQYTQVQASSLERLQQRQMERAERQEQLAAQREDRYWEASAQTRVQADMFGNNLMLTNTQRSPSVEKLRIQEMQRQSLADEQRRSQLTTHQMEASNRAAEYAMRTGERVHEFNMDGQRRTFETGNEAIRQGAEISRLSIEKSAEMVNRSTDASRDILLGTKQADADVEKTRITEAASVLKGTVRKTYKGNWFCGDTTESRPVDAKEDTED